MLRERLRETESSIEDLQKVRPNTNTHTVLQLSTSNLYHKLTTFCLYSFLNKGFLVNTNRPSPPRHEYMPTNIHQCTQNDPAKCHKEICDYLYIAWDGTELFFIFIKAIIKIPNHIDCYAWIIFFCTMKHKSFFFLSVLFAEPAEPRWRYESTCPLHSPSATLRKRINLANLKGSSVCLFGRRFWVEAYIKIAYL